MIDRWMMKDLASAMRVRRGVNLTGARQVGKSTLAKMLKMDNARRYTFDDKFIRQAAESDPYGFVRHAPGHSLVIDEAQKVSDVLEWDEESVYLDSQRNGPLVETWVYQQLAAVAEASGGYAISQYRDTKKREIDFLVERADGAVLGIEVKAGIASADDFRHLKWFGANLAQGPFTGIVLYSGDDVLRFGEGYFAVPLSALGG